MLRGTLRKSDIIARMGGDEFCVLVSESEGEPSMLRARILDAFDTFNETSERPYRLSASIGLIRIWPSDTGTLDEFVARADKLMYQQKRASSRFQKTPEHQRSH